MSSARSGDTEIAEVVKVDPDDASTGGSPGGVAGGGGGCRPLSSVILTMRPRHVTHKRSGVGASERRVDEFGFVVDETDRPRAHLVEDEKVRLHWLAYLEFRHGAASTPLSWQHMPVRLTVDERLSVMLRAGVPHSLRPHIWSRISGSLRKQQRAAVDYERLARDSCAETSLACQQIENDLLRTLPDNVCFSGAGAPGVAPLRRILRTIAWLYPDIGYCQGVGHIVAVLLLFMDEPSVFWLTSTIIEELLPPTYYSQTLIGMRVDQLVLVSLVARRLPQLSALLQRHDIELSLLTAGWFVPLLAGVLPVQHVLRVWDVLLCDGALTLFRITLALLAQHADELCRLDNCADIFSAIAAIPSQVDDIDALLQLAFSEDLGFTAGDVERLRSHHSVSLSADPLTGSVSHTLLAQSKVHRRQIQRSKSMVSVLLFGDSTATDELKTKNIRQTELVVKLCAAIRRLCEHFASCDSRLAAAATLSADYSAQSHSRDQLRYHGNMAAASGATSDSSRHSHTWQPQRAKALLDFERRVDDELGFRRHDVLTVLNMSDEHCWVGRLNGLTGWFPAQFVQLLDERSKLYSCAGDDTVNEKVTHLVRGPLCTALKNILEHGMKRSSILGGACHPWLFVEEVARREVAHDYESVYSRLVLCKTYRLDRDGKVLSPEELLYRSVEAINASHDVVAEAASAGMAVAAVPMDVKLRSLVCAALNEQALHLWLQTLCSSRRCVDKWYETGSFINSPGWIQVKCELRVLAELPFQLSVDWELPASATATASAAGTEAGTGTAVPKLLRHSVQEMLIKHHLFSWDL